MSSSSEPQVDDKGFNSEVSEGSRPSLKHKLNEEGSTAVLKNYYLSRDVTPATKKLCSEESTSATFTICSLHTVTEWWRKTIVYEVYVRSFMDSNGDGIGDLKGIQSKLDYFVDLGVETLWLSPFFTSPMKDFGYDISNFTDVDPIFGTMQDFDDLIAEMKERGMKLVMDFVPNHTSDHHDWFIKSCQKIEPYSDYYIWKPAKGFNEAGQPIPPNNWISVFGGPMWEWNDQRSEFYLHQFTKEQPDLNFQNKLVVEEMKTVLRFWLDRGVSGFRMDAVAHMFEDEEYSDEPPVMDPGDITPAEYGYWDHCHTTDLPKVLDVLREFRLVLDEYLKKDGQERLMMTEAYLDVTELLKYYGTMEDPIAHFPFNFDLISKLQKGFTSSQLYKILIGWLENISEGRWPNWVVSFKQPSVLKESWMSGARVFQGQRLIWVPLNLIVKLLAVKIDSEPNHQPPLGNHDVPRVASRFGANIAELLIVMTLLLPGTCVTYYGEEIGMEDTEISWEETVDPAGRNAGEKKFRNYSRDPERTPMQWTNGANAGFTSAGNQPWLRINSKFTKKNVASQLGVPSSYLENYKLIASLRKQNFFLAGNIELRLMSADILSFSRLTSDGKSGIVVTGNFGDCSTKVNLSVFRNVPERLEVFLRTTSRVRQASNTVEDSAGVPLGPKEGIVLKFGSEDPSL